jgi:hypothetical protein
MRVMFAKPAKFVRHHLNHFRQFIELLPQVLDLRLVPIRVLGQRGPASATAGTG